MFSSFKRAEILINDWPRSHVRFVKRPSMAQAYENIIKIRELIIRDRR